MLYIKDCTLCAAWETAEHILGRFEVGGGGWGGCSYVMDWNTPTLWVWSLLFRTLEKSTGNSVERHSWGVRQRRGEAHTYVEVCGTVKAVLIGHHTSGETEWQREEERRKRRGVGRETVGKTRRVVWCAPMWALKEQDGRMEWWSRGEKRVASRLWRREEKEGWDYYTPCNMQDKIPPHCKGQLLLTASTQTNCIFFNWKATFDIEKEHNNQLFVLPVVMLPH